MILPKLTLSSSYDYLWLGLLLFPILVIAFLLPVTPQDYWWYLPLGRTILETGRVPTVDTLSFTQAGQPIFYQSWLAALIFWLVYRAGGLALTFLLRGLVLALAYGLLWWLVRSMGAGPRLAALITLLSALAGSNNWSIRPQLLAYPLFVLTLLVLYGWHHGGRRFLWALPLLSLLWSNLHGSFALFFILGALAFLLGNGDRRALLPWFLLSFVTVFINPRGFLVIQDTVELLRTPSNQFFSAEWHPPVNAGWQMNIFFAWILLLAPLAAFSPRRLSALEWTWLLVFGWMALSGTRYVIWILFLLAVFTSIWLAPLVGRFLDSPVLSGSRLLNLSLAALLPLSALALLPGLREGWWAQAPLPYEARTTPVAAAGWLSGHPGFPGPMLSDYAFSSYLAFALPSRSVWIDSRFYPFPPEQWRRFQSLAAADPSWSRILEEERINLVLLAYATEPRLIEAMRLSADWCEKYSDADSVLFARCTPIQ
jgi:hypothetical protein